MLTRLLILKRNIISYRDDLQIKEYLSWCEKWISEMVRVTKPTGSIFLHNIPKWLTYYSHFLNQIADFKHWISWDAPTAPMGKTLQPSHYGILFYAKDNKQLKFYEVRYPHKRNRKTNLLMKDYGGKKYLLHPFGSLVSDVWTDIHRIKHRQKRDKHPCQLPVHLLERLILMTTDEDDIILDPFMGTGTTAIASKKLGRNFIGFELDENYFEITNEKITNVDYQQVVEQEGKNVFIFLDPLYYSATSSALYGKNGNLHKNFNHERLASVLKKSKHEWLITYDNSPFIKKLFSFANIKEWN